MEYKFSKKRAQHLLVFHLPVHLVAQMKYHESVAFSELYNL